MVIMAVIEDEDVIKKILKYLELWEVRPRLPSKATRPPKTREYRIDYSSSWLPVSDKWLYVDREYPEAYGTDFTKGA
jgi:hypothetical protein